MMTPRSLSIPDVYVFDVPSFPDNRGIFSIVWQPNAVSGLPCDTTLVQGMRSFNYRRGTLRGLHLQVDPHAQSKWVQATRGTLYDVIVDVRPMSPTFRQWVGITLTASTPQVVYVPAGCAHGYQTLEDNTEMLYFITAPYVPDAERGYRYDDPAFQITWPAGTPTEIHPRDASFPWFSVD